MENEREIVKQTTIRMVVTEYDDGRFECEVASKGEKLGKLELLGVMALVSHASMKTEVVIA